MVKEPVAGRCKTRLAREIGPSAALRFYRHATAALIQRVGRDPRWRTLVAVAPDRAVGARAWPADIARVAQGGGDLGARMQRLIEGQPTGPVLVIGSDIAGVTAAIIADAFRLARRHEVVYGPARDGGFWLVGHGRRRPVKPLFGGVGWSRPETLAMALAVAHGRGMSVGLARTLSDVDDARDLGGGGWRGVRRVAPRF